MVFVEQFHIRVALLVGAVGMFVLLRKPLQYPEKPGSKGFAVVAVAMAFWLGSSGLSYFVAGLRPTLVLYSILLFSITVCFVGWALMAFEFTTGRLPSGPVLAVLGGIVVGHLLALATNFVWLHEFVYLRSVTVENAVLVPARGPGFWIHALLVYAFIAFSAALFVIEGVRSSGLRRQQAAVLAVAPFPGLGANVVWHTGALDLTFDPTPAGIAVGGLFLTWALYRAEFLEVAPIARQTVVEEMPDAVVTVDEKDRVVDWNDAALDVFGIEEPAVGTSLWRFFEAAPTEVRIELLAAGQSETQVAFELDGRERHFSILSSPIDVGQTERLGRVLVIREITAIKRREQQLLRQNEYLDEFASVVSHDIQGPLMEIKGSADAVAKTGETDHIEHVLDAADRMERLVDDLLRLARTGQQIENPEPVDIGSVATAGWQRVWSADAAFVVDDDHTILADPDRLQQLFENLFHNAVEHGSTSSRTWSGDAVEHGGPGVRVRVGTLRDGFFVEDDGPGIPQEEREQVFERGYTSSEDGTGLGLGIVRQIVRAHGWTILVTESEAGGARFEITGVEMPEQEPSERSSREPSERSSREASERSRTDATSESP